MRSQIHHPRLARLAPAIQPFLSNMVFVGGGVLNLYITDQAVTQCRPSCEIDAILNVDSRLEFLQFADQLEDRGLQFVESVEELPLYWTYQGVDLHLIPIHTEILGYFNKWHEEGTFHAQMVMLNGEFPVRVFPPAYYLATKIEAFRLRGMQNFRYSKDFEDIVTLLDGRPEIVGEIQGAYHEVRSYIQAHLDLWLQQPQMIEGLYAILPLELGSVGVERILSRMRTISKRELSWV